MYHTFQASNGPMPGSEGEGGRLKGSRRISTSNACVECRRRKIRCDGARPCSQCQWYQHPEACQYSKPTQRVIPSRKLLDKLSSGLSQYEALFDRLFPGSDLESLMSMSREELINHALTLPAAPSSPDGSPHHISLPDSGSRSDGAESLEALEQAPDHDPDQDETNRHLDTKVQRVSDDVNGLSLSVDKQSSYVGASSVTAALKVIFQVAPGTRHFMAQNGPLETALPSRCNSPPPERVESDPTYLPPAEIGHALIEAYFNRIHALMPMIDEQQFWHTWLYGERKDPAWLALLNTVFTLGSLASSDADSDQHTVYFNRARQHIDLETLGSGNLLVVQALGLLSGYYLHYVNRPNLANSLMGAALRMATVLGLHRNFQEPNSTGLGRVNINKNVDSVPSETRKRTWWSLFCLDTWACVTTGRPSLGRLGPGVTVQPPQVSTDKMNNSQYLTSLKALPLIHNTAFARTSTRIQDKLATTHILSFDDLLSFDAELVNWHEDLPTILLPTNKQGVQVRPRSGSTSRLRKISTTPASATTAMKNPFDFAKPLDQGQDTSTCPEFLKTARAVMHWRYQNLRIILHRPSLLAAALRRVPFASLSAEEKVAVGRCRIIAGQTINDINEMCGSELISGWNGVWFMYQAVMIPLVSLFFHLSIVATKLPQRASLSGSQTSRGSSPSSSVVATGADEDVDKWRAQIETAIVFFDRMQHWSVAAKKSRDVVSRLYEASKHLSEVSFAQHQHLMQQFAQIQQQHQQNDLDQHHLRPEGHVTLPPTTISAPKGDFGRPHSKTPSFSISIPPPPVFNGDGIADAFAGQPIWGYTPAGDTALDSFWQEMQWDSVPVYTNAQAGGPMDLHDVAGLGFAAGDFDWFSSSAGFGNMDNGNLDVIGNGSGNGHANGWNYGL